MLRAPALITAAILTSTLLSACDRIPGTAQNAARSALSQMMFDPGAAKIEFTTETDEAVCGTVNGKNRMGAYVGATPFYFRKVLKFAVIYGGEPTGNDVRMLSLMDASDPNWEETYRELAAKCQFPKEWATYCGTAPGPTSNDICKTFDEPKGFTKLLGQYRRAP